MRVAAFKAFVTVTAALSVAATAFGAVRSTSEYKPDEIIVKYKSNVRRSRLAMEGIYLTVNVVKVKRFGSQMRQFEQLILEEGTDLNNAIAALEKDPSVEYAQPNYILKALPVEVAQEAKPAPAGIPCIPGMDIPGCDPKACLFPNFPPGCKDSGGGQPPGEDPKPPGGGGRPPVADKPADPAPGADPDLDKAWGIAKIHAPEAWKVTPGSQSMVVAVIDTGIDYNHDELSFNVWRNPAPDAKLNDVVGFDFIHNDGLPFDDHAHGTHCSGVIGAVGNNGKGISGVNQRVSIMGLKFLSAEGSGDTAGAIKAIDYAVTHGAKVLSNSWGGKGDDDNKGLRDAIQRAEDKDVLFIAAAGNDGTNNDTDQTFPASLNAPNMISVAALDSNDGLAYFSNTGAKSVQVGAPGVDVYSTTPGNKYQKMSGTSMACPHVAGAAALLWSAHPQWTHKEVKARLMESVDKLPSLEGKTVTGGRINVAKALGAL
ncbi:MAG: S8 family serine peptidase [Deltaproteobacteria bacterium]|nr:S8 family serine peptidase [Deltaproteobacteria bacterium]